MKRIPEPELMSEEAQAIAYANADFEEPHSHFIELLADNIGRHLPESGWAVDLGCGAADISIRFAKAYPHYHIDALDGAAAMLAEAAKALAVSGLTDRITLIEACLNVSSLAGQNYDLILSNSLLHHLHDPMILWQAIKDAKGIPCVFIMDLMRPENDARVNYLVDQYAGNEPAILQRDFGNSLKAAFTPAEVKSQLSTAGLEMLSISIVSDRHFIVSSQR